MYAHEPHPSAPFLKTIFYYVQTSYMIFLVNVHVFTTLCSYLVPKKHCFSFTNLLFESNVNKLYMDAIQ